MQPNGVYDNESVGKKLQSLSQSHMQQESSESARERSIRFIKTINNKNKTTIKPT